MVITAATVAITGMATVTKAIMGMVIMGMAIAFMFTTVAGVGPRTA
ncbi:hypothetical protein [Bradyrhizobium sp. OHSU_III]|nr:hypothetical protein [Bradyrhizobium sp. OHSU_III]